MPRPPKLRPISIDVFWAEASQQWLGFLPIKDAQGKVIKRAKRSSSKPDKEGKLECEQKIRELEDELAEEAARRAANVAPKGRVYRVHAWLRYWLHEIKFPKVSYNMFRDYRLTVEKLIIPNLDDCEFPDFEAAGIELMLKRIRHKHRGSTDKPNRAYRHLRMGLRAAAARPKETGLWHNPIVAVDMPAHESPEPVPFTVDETRRILTAARQRPRNKARWTIGWAFGMRPGEVLALKRKSDFYLVYAHDGSLVPHDLWDSVDLDTALGVLWINENLYRRKWEHGCDDPHTCNGGRYHRYPCPKTGAKHARYHRGGCPKVTKFCEPDCAEHAAQCEHRHGGVAPDGTLTAGGQVRKAPKSKAGRRRLFLPKGPTEDLLDHLREQDKEKVAAGDLWLDSGALFATKRGGLINERDDTGEFHEIVDAAGLEHKRPYDGRHGAATMLLRMKVNKRYVMDALGWSSEAMLKRYQHMIFEMRREVGDAIGSLLWDETGFASDTATDLATSKVIDLGERRQKRA